MNTFIRHAVMLLAVAAICRAVLASANDSQWASSGSQSATLTGEEKAAANDRSACTGCSEWSRDPCGGRCVDDCESCPPWEIVGAFGFDSFKGVGDWDEQSNFGVVTGLNSAMPVPGLSDYGIGWQLGTTYGVYDWDGNSNGAKSQQQVFVTTGFYRKGDDDQRLSFGIVYDWMINDSWGTHGVAPTLGQWRGQIEYALSDTNAVGGYACVQDRSSSQWCLNNHLVRDRAVDQVNLFWHHKFLSSGADSWLWAGLPEHDRLGGDGSLGDWIVGANLQVPITDRLAVYGNAQYMHPSAAAGQIASLESDWNVGVGIMWYFGGHAASSSVNGNRWLPYMPVANNSTFLVDEYSPRYL
jgi:hypothetical protein